MADNEESQNSSVGATDENSGPSRNNRKARNTLIDTKGQLRLFIPLAVLLVGAMVLVLTLYRVMLNAVADLTQNVSNECASGLTNVVEVLYRLEVVVTVGIVAMGVLTFILGLYYSHRVFGPKVALLRQVKALSDGDYSALVTLRKLDEFQDLAEALNHLGKKLQQRHGK